MKFFIALILLSLNLQFAKAQKQGNIWMGGGNGGIDFNSDTTVSFFRPDSSIFGRTSASICDTNGVTEEKSSNPSKPHFILGSVYPNPTIGSITVENYCMEEVMVAKLLDQLGKQVLKITLPKGNSQQTISLASLPAGPYIMHLAGCETTMQQLIVKIR